MLVHTVGNQHFELGAVGHIVEQSARTSGTILTCPILADIFQHPFGVPAKDSPRHIGDPATGRTPVVIITVGVLPVMVHHHVVYQVHKIQILLNLLIFREVDSVGDVAINLLDLAVLTAHWLEYREP
jgi:hypothetical protein